jgi:hypothetical protein
MRLPLLSLSSTLLCLLLRPASLASLPLACAFPLLSVSVLFPSVGTFQDRVRDSDLRLSQKLRTIKVSSLLPPLLFPHSSLLPPLLFPHSSLLSARCAPLRSLCCDLMVCSLLLCSPLLVLQAEYQKREAEECTFKPQITPRRPASAGVRRKKSQSQLLQNQQGQQQGQQEGQGQSTPQGKGQEQQQQPSSVPVYLR